MEEEVPVKRAKLEPIDVDERIRDQVEYYFSDVNVVKDKFLQEEFKKADGWISLEVLLRFSRLQQLTKDENTLIEALKGSDSKLIDFDKEKKQIRRKNPLPDFDEYNKNLRLRTVHISGFPQDYNFEVLRRFCAQYGEVESLSMRRYFKTRFFKGCVHVVYKSAEDAKKVLETEVLKCKDRELRKESMEEYDKRKAEMAEKRANKRKNKSQNKDN